MPGRKIAAEIKLMANDYRKLPREVQLAFAGNLHEMAMKFAVAPAEPEIAQPKPAKGGRVAVSDPPGMPTRRFGSPAKPAKTEKKFNALTFDAYVDELFKGMNRPTPVPTSRYEIKIFATPGRKVSAK